MSKSADGMQVRKLSPRGLPGTDLASCVLEATPKESTQGPVVQSTEFSHSEKSGSSIGSIVEEMSTSGTNIGKSIDVGVGIALIIKAGSNT